MIDGGCLCGRLRYRLEPSEALLDVCHCEQCRRASGSVFVGWAQVAPERFEVIRGEPSSQASSPGVRRYFCGNCGTPTHMSDEEGRSVGVTLGSLDHPETLVPKAHGFFSRRLSWLTFEDDWERFAESPPYDET